MALVSGLFWTSFGGRRRQFPSASIRQFSATSPGLTLNDGLYREQYQNGLELGTEVILNYPAAPHRPWNPHVRWLTAPPLHPHDP